LCVKGIYDAEMEKRKKAFKPREPRIKTGCLGLYTKLIASASTGAIIKD
jgi:dihydroxy-acid dehydratase